MSSLYINPLESTIIKESFILVFAINTHEDFSMLLYEIQSNSYISNSSVTFNIFTKDWMKRIKNSRPYLIGTIDKKFRIGVVDNEDKKLVAAYDLSKDKFAAFADFQHFSGAASNVYEELVIAADKEYRGLGLVTKMYQLLIVEEGLIIISDSSHSRGAQSTWEKLSMNPEIDVFGYNTETKKVFQVDMEDLFNEDVYDNGLDEEIDDLERELSQLEFSPGSNQQRVNQIEKELDNLNKEKQNTVDNIRLFAGKKK